MKLKTRFYLSLPEVAPGKYAAWRSAIHREIRHSREASASRLTGALRWRRVCTCRKPGGTRLMSTTA